MLQLDFGENNRQLVDQILLFIVLSEDRGHLLLQVADDMGMDLGGQRVFNTLRPKREPAHLNFGANTTYPNQACALDQIVELA